MHIYLNAFIFKVIAPIIYLIFFAYGFTLSGIKLAEAWSKKNLKKIWLYLWIILDSVVKLNFPKAEYI